MEQVVLATQVLAYLGIFLIEAGVIGSGQFGFTKQRRKGSFYATFIDTSRGLFCCLDFQKIRRTAS